LPRSNVCSTRDLENPSASVHLKRFSTPSLTLKFLCAGKLNPRKNIANDFFALQIVKIAGCASVITTFSPGEVERAVVLNVANLKALCIEDQTTI
jgi:hypothetical protein